MSKADKIWQESMLGDTSVGFTKECHHSFPPGPYDRTAGKTTIHSPDPDFLKKKKTYMISDA